MATTAEEAACTPVPIKRDRFNPCAVIPYGLDIDAIYQSMVEFTDFLGFINTQLNSKGVQRFESMLMPANFSSMVGEFIIATIPKYCKTLAKNKYHNGHPDLLPEGRYPGDSVQHEQEGIEVKASRYLRGWQGHNAEDCWLMVFCFVASRGSDLAKGIAPRPFAFKRVYLGQIVKADWIFSGRKEGSRRTITASVTQSGYEKMTRNWIYSDDDVDAVEEAAEPPEEASE
ncbi:MAG TPA: hypothetical protein VMG10_03770 [Gemmataceae bacterium]|nr:hypothetical protein [Gemmataceae bacterium]